MSKWEEKKLGNLFKIKHGYAFKGEYISDTDNNQILVTPGNFNIGGGFKDSGKKFYTGDIPVEYILKERDLVVTMTDLSKEGDTLGYSALIPKNSNTYLHNQRIGLLYDISPEVDNNFLYWLLRTPWYQKRIVNTSNGTSVKHTSPSRIYNYKTQLPDLPTQKRIADILSAYDDLIENNNRRIALLEKAAQDLYKEWFVRFRFPDYEKTTFVNGIPEGWEVKRLGDVVKLKSGFAFKSSWWKDSGIPVIKIKDIQNNTIDFSDLAYVSTENAKKSKQFYVTGGDLLIALTGATIGKLGLVPDTTEITINQRVGKFFLGEKPFEKVSYIFCLFSQDSIQEKIITIANSNAAQPNISPFDIEKFKITYNEKLVNLFNSKCTPIISEVLKLKNSNQNLKKQRDLLLPRLMSGKMEV